MNGSRTNWKAVALLVLVFVLGLAIGGLGTHLMMEHGQRRFGRWGHQDHQRIVERLTRELGLTPEQQTQLKTILEDTRSRFQAIYEQTRPQYEATRDQARDRIRAILTPEQRPKFEEFARRLDEERKKRSGR